MARREPTGPSATRSRLKVGGGYFGPLPDQLWDLLKIAQESPFSTSSTLAREAAWVIALAASMGWLSVINPDGQSYSRLWRITPEGGFALGNKEHGT